MSEPTKLPHGTVTLEKSDGVAWVRLARPQLANTMNLELAKDLHEASLACGDDAEVRAVVLTGEGRFFCAGGDVRYLHGQGDALSRAVRESTTYLHAAISRFARMDAPVISAVNGPAAGGGVCLVAMSDLAIAARSAHFTAAFPQIGFSMDCGGTFFLPRVMGERRALEFILSGARLSAEEALAAGLVTRVVPDTELLAQAGALAARLASGATRAFGGIKRLVRAATSTALEAHLENESRTLAETVNTRDAREGLAAFAEKRAARFEGC
jgi:2-(1,2-epoxy-1,2-dihydrophenyl)acetyl-CoA isomerase